MLGAGGLAVYYVTRAVLTRDFDLTLRAAVPEAAARVSEQLPERLATDRLLPLELKREPPLVLNAHRAGCPF